MDIEGLNAIPILEEYKRNPDATYLVKLAVAGITNCLPNIDADGANSMGFHLHPANNVFDSYSGDWGIGFFASARHAGSFLVEDPILGLVCFLCDIVVSNGNGSGDESSSAMTHVVTLRDAWRKKLFISSLGVEVVSEAGTIASITVGAATVVVTFDAATAQSELVSTLRLRADQPAAAAGNRPWMDVTLTSGNPQQTVASSHPNPVVRGAWEIPQAKSGVTEVTLNFIANLEK